jgi:Helix-hairpin-helix domain
LFVLPPSTTTNNKQQTIAANKDMSARDILVLLVEDYGYVEDKKAMAAAKQVALASSAGHPANAALIAAISELADLYYKDGNKNAGGSYKKVVKALSELQYEITALNALGLHKGKTKVVNIGKGSAEKIHEFMTTGTISKLEEKRAHLA